jgi:hypothetical protein
LDPNIVTKNIIGIVLRWNFLNKTQGLTFLGRNLYGRYPLDVKFQKSKYFFWFLDLNIVTKSTIRFVLRWNFLNKTQGLTLLSRNFYGRYPKDVKFQKSEYFFWFLDLNIVTKSTIRFVLRWNFLNKTQGLTLLSRNLYGRYPKDVKFQKSEYFCWFLDLNMVNKSAVGFVLRWNFHNKTQGFTLLSRNLCGRYP